MDGAHWINHPAHAASLVLTLYGHTKALRDSDEEDPLLYALLCLDHLPKMAGLIIAIEKWCTAVNDATPDQIYESGAQPCH
jgi:hypothetical protein